MKNDKAHFVAFVGVMFALIFVLFLLEGAISLFAGSTPCILSLPVAVSLSIFDDWKKSFIGGTLLGLSSCLFSLIFASIFLPYANPLISVLPRVFIGITAYWTYFGLSRLFGKAKNKYVREVLPAAIAGSVGTITNTVLYMTSLYIWNGWLSDFYGQEITTVIQVLTIVYFAVEIVACFILVPIYVKVLKKINHRFIEVKNVTPQDDRADCLTDIEE